MYQISLKPPKSWDLLVASLLTSLMLGFSLWEVGNGLPRVLIGLFFSLFLPGYVLTTALFSPFRMSNLTRVTFSIGLSLILLVLGGLLLNLCEINQKNWTILLSAIIFIGIGVTFLRRKRSLVIIGEIPWSPRKLFVISFFAPAIVLVILALAISGSSASQNRSAPFSQFWFKQGISLLPYLNISSYQFEVGITSMERAPATYTVEVKKGNQVLKRWDNINLNVGDVWQNNFTLDIERDSNDPVEANLYLNNDQANPYRRVNFWANTLPAR